LAVIRNQLLTSAGELDFDLCLWSVGFGFARLPRDAGLAVDEHGRVRVDPCLRSSSHADVYAIGDIANPVVPPGQALPMGCKSASPMGAYVADSLAGLLRGHEPRPFDFATPMYCVSLGRRDGLIQIVRDDGEPTGPVVTGRAAAVLKELVCKATMWSLQLERMGLSGVAWKRTGHAPALPVAKAL
jgi:NADH dehydrogenase